jgi:hypothetical protein
LLTTFQERPVRCDYGMDAYGSFRLGPVALTGPCSLV